MSDTGNGGKPIERNTRILADIAHELRTPIGGILGINELLLSTKLDVEQAEFAKVVQTSAKSMLSILTDLSELAHLEAKEVSLNNELFELSRTIYECSYALKGVLQTQNIKLNTTVDDSGKQLFGDSTRLTQALVACISGVSRFIEYGEIQLNATVDALEATKVNFVIVLPSNTVNRDGQPIFTQMIGSETEIKRYDSTWLRFTVARRIFSALKAELSVDNRTLTIVIPMPEAA